MCPSRKAPLADRRGRSRRERVVAGVRYAWPVTLERATPLRARARAHAFARCSTASARTSPEPLAVIGVYRRRNTATLSALLAQVDRRAEIALWALDEVAPELSGVTVGVGRGPKFALLNELLGSLRPCTDRYVAVVDDDVFFSHGDLGRLVAVGAALGLDLFQPAHGWSSIFTYPMLVARPRTLARQTTFVEIGPLFVIGPGWQDRLLPFGEEYQMGWGMDVWWSSLAGEGCRLGVVDACRMVHTQPVGASYDRTDEILRHEDLVRAAGASSVYDLMRTVRRWRRSEGPPV